MAFFLSVYNKRLYTGPTGADDKGFVAFVIPENRDSKGDPIELVTALQSETFNGSFVFSAKAPVITDAGSADQFLRVIYTVLKNISATRAIIWLKDPGNINKDTASLMGINKNGSATATGLNTKIAPQLAFTVANGVKLTLRPNSTLLDLQSTDSVIGFAGAAAPTIKPSPSGLLNFSGPLRGCIQFRTYIKRDTLYTKWQWGFHYLFPRPEDPGKVTSCWYPLASTKAATDFIGFDVSIDSSDLFNTAFDTGSNFIAQAYAARRTYFNFTGRNFDQATTTLDSFYRTAFGAGVTLVPLAPGNDILPARLVFTHGEQISNEAEKFLVSPEGDFNIALPGVTNAMNQYLQCGLQGTEFFKITPRPVSGTGGDSIRFLSRQPAWCAVFPFQSASPVKAPEDPTASLLTGPWLTSWATLISAPGNTISYVSQPKGASLFGNDRLITPAYTDLFGHTTPDFIFKANDTIVFPLAPYAGVIPQGVPGNFTPPQIGSFESAVISPTRRKLIGAISTIPSVIPPGIPLTEPPASSTTPLGLLVTTTQQGNKYQWNKVFLGQNTDDGITYRMQFINPDEKLIEALQTSDLFLVCANNNHLGTLMGTEPDKPGFEHIMSINNWMMQANVGVGNQYNDYRNVMIIKGRRGKLYDANDNTASLVANPKKWTQAAAFAAPANPPGTEPATDIQQLVILSQWLQDYCKQAAAKSDNAYFSQFNQLISDENWTGILFLRMDIKQLPSNLTGIMAGVTHPELFNVHHLAISISPVVKGKGASGAVVDQPSSIYGLIYYVDPDFTDREPAQAIVPTTAQSYDFRLLSLKVLFTNTTVRKFESNAQLTLNQFFNSAVDHMGDVANTWNNVLLQGSFQLNNGKAVYSLGSRGDNAFYFNSNVLNKIQVSNVLLTTRNPDNSGTTASVFSLEGFIDYKVVKQVDEQNPAKTLYYDIFSFGNLDGQDNSRKGLSFNNLAINMTFPVTAPLNKSLTFDASAITFDVSKSTPRPGSLYIQLALDMDSLVAGSDEQTPADLGYLAVLPDIRMQATAKTAWFGLKFRLNMGTPGELAGKINLVSWLLLSWWPDSAGVNNYKTSIGISLPGTSGGAKLISLQNIMKLSIGQILLKFDDRPEKKAFLLLFTEIAIKFFGLLKIPPAGSTLFYLFGNPDSGGKASGLGWYAMYRSDQPKQAMTPAAPETLPA
ncbi:hypothetical protein HB364_18070 [Pseudoflavitalea sp. X16]|uniref:hypothetical protein n=1 Tax=Paraflavitalea devenefica TaxID=2716334 RepID=UPI00141E7860|nr:hypothetical protein [Paraflavitalea devenefica]NII27003.1 hypothetical protein [Paraflavitalea devenefica]